MSGKGLAFSPHPEIQKMKDVCVGVTRCVRVPGGAPDVQRIMTSDRRLD